MYMGAINHSNTAMSSTNITLYMGAYGQASTGAMHTFPRAYLQIQPLLLLELRSNARTKNGPCAGSTPARASSQSSATVSGHGGHGTDSITMA
jgi:hypothetical protein